MTKRSLFSLCLACDSLLTLAQPLDINPTQVSANAWLIDNQLAHDLDIGGDHGLRGEGENVTQPLPEEDLDVFAALAPAALAVRS